MVDEGVAPHLSRLKTGQMVGPLRTKRGFVILALVEKKGPSSPEHTEKPTQDQVRRALLSKRLESLSHKELTQLKSRTFIDVRH